ncbi:hypothetical protein EON80_20900 [bacterium]|nr:MAG: hypothetical protein EON80_20900 [bacterium]
MNRSILLITAALFIIPTAFIFGGLRAKRVLTIEPTEIKLVKAEYPRRLLFSPDSKRLLVNSEIYDVQANAKICELRPPFGGNAVWSPDGQRIVSAFDTKPYFRQRSEFETPPPNVIKIRVWDSTSGSGLTSCPFGAEFKYAGIDNLSFTGDGQKLIAAGFPFQLLDARNGQPLQRFTPSDKKAEGQGVRGDLGPAENLIVWRYDKKQRLEVIDLKTNRPVWQSPMTEIGALTLKWGRRNVLGLIQADLSQKTIHLNLWDGNKRQLLPIVPIEGAFKFALNDQSDLVAVGHGEIDETRDQPFFNNRITLYDYRARKSLLSIAQPQMPDHLEWSPNGKYLLVQEGPAGLSKRLSVYNLSGQLVLTSREQGVALATWSPDSKHIAAALLGGVRLLTLPEE